MKLKAHILLALLCAMLSTSCDIEREREVCDYRVQLRYDYNEENTSSENVIEQYVSHLDELIFDSEGILLQRRRFTQDECVEFMVSEFVMLPGRYSVIAVGNIDGRSLIYDELLGDLIVGTTRREDVRLSLEDAEDMEDGMKGHSERLYYGYKTFTVRPEGLSSVRVNMLNAHMELTFRVVWERVTPSREDDYYAVLESVPSEYMLMPEYISNASNIASAQYDPAAHDTYPHHDNSVNHHIPHTTHQGRNIHTHRLPLRIDGDGQMQGRFINYRIQRNTRPLLKIFRKGATRGQGDEQLLRTINLQDYLDYQGYENPATTLRQLYELDITVREDGKLMVMPMNISDWSEGGEI